MPPITIISKTNLPERILRAHPPPSRIYMRGNLPNLEKYKLLAVVGARRFSDYGEQVCRGLIADLAPYPIIIVSGLAIGIDSIAHESALQAGLTTIAVPGSSLDEHKIYPRQKRYLAKKILEAGGCLLSEYAPSHDSGQPWMFPERNRIMAALSDAVLVIEAQEKSGTLITARLALDYNKEVLAVPGSIFSNLSKGPHFLLSQGAAPVTSAKDIVESLGLEWIDSDIEKVKAKQAETKTLFESCTEEEKSLLALLPCSRDTLIQSLGKPAQHVAMAITLLEIKGLIKEEVGIIKKR